MNCLWCSYSGFNSKPWAEASFTCKSILRQEKRSVSLYSWVYESREICITPWVLRDWHCSSAMVTASKEDDLAMSLSGAWSRGSHCSTVWLSPEVPGIFPSASVDSGPHPRETNLSSLSLKFGRWVPYLTRTQAPMSLSLLETRKSCREPEANTEPRAENFLPIVSTKRKTSF